MLKHVWTVICERCVADKESGMVSFLTCIEGIMSPVLPAVPALFCVGTRWHNTGNAPASLDIKLFSINPSGKETMIAELPTQIVQEKSDQRIFVDLQGIKFSSYGYYTFVIKQKVGSKWHIVSEIPIGVLETKPSKAKPAVK